MGDWNARLHSSREGEKDVVGGNVFGRGQRYLEQISRDRVLFFKAGLTSQPRKGKRTGVYDTTFDKPDIKLISFMVPGTNSVEEIDAEKFATADHVLGYS